jgi:hypothetical protein
VDDKKRASLRVIMHSSAAGDAVSRGRRISSPSVATTGMEAAPETANATALSRLCGGAGANSRRTVRSLRHFVLLRLK